MKALVQKIGLDIDVCSSQLSATDRREFLCLLHEDIARRIAEAYDSEREARAHPLRHFHVPDIRPAGITWEDPEK